MQSDNILLPTMAFGTNFESLIEMSVSPPPIPTLSPVWDVIDTQKGETLWKHAGSICAVVLLGLSVLLTSVASAVDTIAIDMGGTPVVLSVNTTNKAMLTRLLIRENTRRAAQSPPLTALTLEEFERDLIVDMFRGYKVQSAGQDHVDACVTFNGLSAAQQQTILTTLLGNSPCP